MTSILQTSNDNRSQAAMMNAYIFKVPFSEIRLRTGFRKTYFWTEVGA